MLLCYKVTVSSSIHTGVGHVEGSRGELGARASFIIFVYVALNQQHGITDDSVLVCWPTFGPWFCIEFVDLSCNVWGLAGNAGAFARVHHSNVSLGVCLWLSPSAYPTYMKGHGHYSMLSSRSCASVGCTLACLSETLAPMKATTSLLALV